MEVKEEKREKEGRRETEVSGGSVFQRKRMSRLQRVCCSVGGYLIVMTAVGLQV